MKTFKIYGSGNKWHMGILILLILHVQFILCRKVSYIFPYTTGFTKIIITKWLVDKDLPSSLFLPFRYSKMIKEKINQVARNCRKSVVRGN